MSLAGFALRYRVIVTTAVVLLMIWGILAYTGMSRREDPEYIVRTCQVLTPWPGTPTERVEDLVTAPLEEEINGLDGVRWVRSETSVGRSAIYVELDRSTPGHAVEQMWDKVRSRVDRVQMPEPGIKPLVIDDFGDTNIMLLCVYQKPLPGEDQVREENRYSMRDLEIFAERVGDDIKLLAGVAKVTLVGVRSEAIYLETDLGTWTQLALGTNALEQLLAARNVIAPGGSIDTDEGRFSVKPSGDLDAVHSLESLVVGAAGDDAVTAPVYLRDLGLRVVRGFVDPPLEIARYGDAASTAPSVIVAFSMKAGSNIVAVCAQAKEVIERLTVTEKALPPDVGVGIVSDQSENVTAKINDFVLNVVGAVVIVVAVVYLMVGFRPAAVMAANIPLVVVGSIAIITLFGIELEQISLAAMIIALGMLVDNAVQICDQTLRLQSEGKSRFEAALEGSNQLSFPILIATGTTIAAFLPMVFALQGSTKEYIFSLPVTLTVTLALSYVLAMTFCVLLAYWFIRAPADPNEPASPVLKLWRLVRGPQAAPPAGGKAGFWAELYPNLVRRSLGARYLVVPASFALLFVIAILPVGSEFFPKDIRDQFTIDLWLPESASIEQTDNAARRVEEIIQKLSPLTDENGDAVLDESGTQVERLRAMCTVVGKGCARWYLGRSPESPKPNFAELVVRTTDGTLTPRFVRDILRVATEGDTALGIEPVTDARVIPRELFMGPVVDAPIGIRIFGPRLGAGFADLNVMREEARKLEDILRQHPHTWDIYNTWGSPSYQLAVDVDEDRANLAGVTNASLARTLNMYFGGHYLTDFREGDNVVPVYLRLPPEQRGSVEELNRAYVEGLYGKVPLDSVADIELRWDPAKIERRFLQRVIEVRARVTEGVRANDVVNETLESAAYKAWEDQLPPGYRTEIGGELFESNQSKPELALSLQMSILFIILLLIIQYNGVAKPLIIMTTVPLALIGAILGLYLTGNALGFMPQLGVLSLFGVVVNAAIIYIEFAETLIKEESAKSDGSGPILGLSREQFYECLVRAGQVRLPPIAMTTLTTIGGLLPLAVAGGPLWEGMSWLMIFGLTVATLLTLVVVPCLFAIFVEVFKMSPVSNAAGET